MNVKRAYSTITVKAFDEETRTFEGIATTPTTDRMGDIVESEGAEFSLPIPLLWQHNHNDPIGNVVSAKVTKKGIKVKAEVAKLDSGSDLAKRLDEAWEAIKSGLVRGLSIGFSALEYNFMDNGGIHFLKWNWHELSAVTIPANVDGNITNVKRFDVDADQSALGQPKGVPVVRINKSVGVTTPETKHVTIEGDNVNIQEQLEGFKASRVDKQKSMESLMEKAASEGRTLDAAESEEYDALKQEIDAIDSHVKRLEEMELINKQTAEPVVDKSGMQTKTFQTPKVKEELEPGIEFARYTMCLGAAKGDLATASAIAQKRFPNSERINTTLKAAVEAGTTTDATWALPLVEYNQFAGDFVEYLRPQTILGQFGQGGIPALRAVPFNIHIRGQTSGGSGYWVGEGAPKPLTKLDFNDTYLGYAKVANIAVLTEELMRFSNPSAEALVRDALAGAIIERLDVDFIDPAKAAVANESPASVTNGVTPIVSSGTDADAIRADVQAAMAPFIAANISMISGVWVMSATTALSLSLMRNALGQKEFPDMTMLGGTFEGLPVIVSEHVPSDSSGHYVALMSADNIWLADDGNVVIDASREASLQMLDNPTNNSGTGTATTMVSMFQTNSVAIRAERWINWAKRRASAVSLISGVNWGETVS